MADHSNVVAWANVAPEEGEVYSVSLKREPYHDTALVLESELLATKVEAAAADASIGHLSRLIDRQRQALDLLAGLHPGLTVDDPVEAAQRIFDHVQAQQAEHQRAVANDRRNIETRDELIRKLRAGTTKKDDQHGR